MSACHYDADPDPVYHFDADPDPNPTFQFDADPDHNTALFIADLSCVNLMQNRNITVNSPYLGVYNNETLIVLPLFRNEMEHFEVIIRYETKKNSFSSVDTDTFLDAGRLLSRRSTAQGNELTRGTTELVHHLRLQGELHRCKSAASIWFGFIARLSPGGGGGILSFK